MIKFKYKKIEYYTTYNKKRLFKTSKKFFHFDENKNQIIQIDLKNEIFNVEKTKTNKGLILNNKIFESIVTNKIMNKRLSNGYLFEIIKAFHFNIFKKSLNYNFDLTNQKINFEFNGMDFTIFNMKYNINLQSSQSINAMHNVCNVNVIFEKNFIFSEYENIFKILNYILTESISKYSNKQKNLDSIFNTFVYKMVKTNHSPELKTFYYNFNSQVNELEKLHSKINFKFKYDKEIKKKIFEELKYDYEKIIDHGKLYKKNNFKEKIKIIKKLKDDFNFDAGLLENLSFINLVNEYKNNEKELKRFESLNDTNEYYKKQKLEQFEKKYGGDIY